MGGRRIALIRQTGSDAELFVVEANGKNLKQLTTAGAGGPPAWTRDGSRIAYLHGGDIWLVNRDGTNPVNLTETPEPVEATPRFSPDGSLLLFNRIVSFGEGDAFLLDLATGTETNLTNSPMVLDGAVTWSPDGEKILGNGPTTGLFVMDADGTDVIHDEEASGRPVAKDLLPVGRPGNRAVEDHGRVGQVRFCPGCEIEKKGVSLAEADYSVEEKKGAVGREARGGLDGFWCLR